MPASPSSRRWPAAAPGLPLPTRSSLWSACLLPLFLGLRPLDAVTRFVISCCHTTPEGDIAIRTHVTSPFRCSTHPHARPPTTKVALIQLSHSGPTWSAVVAPEVGQWLHPRRVP